MRFLLQMVIVMVSMLLGGCAKDVCPGNMPTSDKKSVTIKTSSARAINRMAKPSMIHTSKAKGRKPPKSSTVYTAKSNSRRPPK